MYINSGYLNNSLLAFVDMSRPLIVGSCGTYRLIKQQKFPTYRPNGRIDYQLLYVANGKAHFFFHDKEEIVPAGHMVLYRPNEMQKYVYYGTDQTEVYWVHFTGSDVENILTDYGFSEKEHVFYTGTLPEYHQLFKQMIQELQLCKLHYKDMLASLLLQLFVRVNRQFTEKNSLNSYAQNEIIAATHYFGEHYNQAICIEEYAAAHNMSISWFIRIFKQYNQVTPTQYILSIRMTNAQALLERTDYNISEIAAFVGYDNPLYFSRLFKKHTGYSPSDFRKIKHIHTE